MDSLSLYYNYCNKANKNSEKVKNDGVNCIVQKIYEEIWVPPFDVRNASFIKAVIRMLGEKRFSFVVKSKTNHVSTVDAYVIIGILCKFICKKQSLINSKWAASRTVFDGKEFKFGGSKKKEEICVWIENIQDSLQIGQKVYETLSQKEDMDNKIIPFDSKEIRLRNNQNNINKWYEHQSVITGELMAIKPTISKMMEDVMAFSDRITQNYVLQFARQEIDLFNLICDNYEYHIRKTSDTNNTDYVNAVANYEEFLSVVVDNLAVFGVEEIKSKEGTLFDGKLHAVESQNFSTKTAMINKSIRSGFRYKDIVIQKEKVVLQQEETL